MGAPWWCHWLSNRLDWGLGHEIEPQDGLTASVKSA